MHSYPLNVAADLMYLPFTTHHLSKTHPQRVKLFTVEFSSFSCWAHHLQMRCKVLFHIHDIYENVKYKRWCMMLGGFCFH